MMKPKTFEELGKSAFTIAVAWFIFGIIQPIFSEKFSLFLSIIAVAGFLIFTILGIALLERSQP